LPAYDFLKTLIHSAWNKMHINKDKE